MSCSKWALVIVWVQLASTIVVVGVFAATATLFVSVGKAVLVSVLAGAAGLAAFWFAHRQYFVRVLDVVDCEASVRRVIGRGATLYLGDRSSLVPRPRNIGVPGAPDRAMVLTDERGRSVYLDRAYLDLNDLIDYCSTIPGMTVVRPAGIAAGSLIG